jgi:nucleotide-binding universal stress UspA family protein
MYRHIAVAIDGGELSARAVSAGAQLAKSLGARLSLIWVAEPYAPQVLAIVPYPFVPVISDEEFGAQVDEIAARLFAEASATARAHGIDEVHCERATAVAPYKGLLEAAERLQADLLVMASHGRRGIGAMVLGSETQKVLTHSSIPVLVIR